MKIRNTKTFLRKALLFLIPVILFFAAFLYSEKKNDNQSTKSGVSTNGQTPAIGSSPTNTPTPTPFLFQGLPTGKFYITYYGWPDNSPPGTEIAYPKRKFPASKHNAAGGTGTFEDPVTFATNSDKIPVGTILYVPYIAKYAVMEDICASCKFNANHIDIWMESESNFEDGVESCEEDWTRKIAYVVTKPTPNLPVNTASFFNKGDGTCNSY